MYQPNILQPPKVMVNPSIGLLIAFTEKIGRSILIKDPKKPIKVYVQLIP